jgi:molybdopterin-guanine dinucleotide biosynthesis protein A/rhodanese-related sulfurtransferase
VLVGGASRRYGRDKALAEVRGRAMAAIALEALDGAGATESFTVGGDDRGLGVRHVPDRHPGSGPLGGLLTACSATERSIIVVLACDLPEITAPVVRALVDSLCAAVDSNAAVAFSARAEPLCAAYRVVGVEPIATELFEAGERSMQSLLDRIRWLAVPVAPRSVVNVNSPHDHVALPPMIHEISVNELAERLAAGATVFDVREPNEYEEERVPGAIPIPLATVPDRVDEFPADGDVLVICRSGGRSMRACEFLAAHGRSAINVAGGTLAWIAAGFDVASGPGLS